MLDQFVLEVANFNADDQPPFATFAAVFNKHSIKNFRFADVDRLLIKNLPVASLPLWIHGEVELACRRAFAHSDPVVKRRVQIVSSPIMILIAEGEKDRFTHSLRTVTDQELPTSDDPLCFLGTTGPRRAHTGDLLKALTDAGIDTVTALSFGQKARLSNYSWLQEIAVGPASAHNTIVEIDVGVNAEPIAEHEHSIIIVRDRHNCVWPGNVKHFPMFWELASSGSEPAFGTFQLLLPTDRAIKQVVKYLHVYSASIIIDCILRSYTKH